MSIDATDFIPNNDPLHGMHEGAKTSIWNGYRISRIYRNNPIKFWIANLLETVGKGMMDPDLFDPSLSFSTIERSSCFSTNGEKAPHLGIGGINGINVSLDKAHSHTNYINQFAVGHSIDWVYNRSHGAIADLAEVFLLNYLGFSPKCQPAQCKISPILPQPRGYPRPKCVGKTS